MTIRVTLANRNASRESFWPARVTEEATSGLPLEDLFTRLAKHHPELAPILEDATHQSDLEIRVNDRRIADAENLKLRDGDTVSLFVK